MTVSNRRFRAFISYSQKDKRHAKRLHKALESYRIPKDVDAPGIIDPKTRRLGRFFRDDEEMGAATDLGNELRGALADSENLIVICSPHAAQSKWVNDEIIHFKLTGRSNRIFAVIVAGEPNASLSPDPDMHATECFPKALRFEIDSDGQLTDQPTEPLGLDTRVDNFARLRVRLAAGLLDLPFDQLWRRDRRRARRIRRNSLVATTVATTIGAIVITSVMEAYNLDRSRFYGAIALQALERDNVNSARRLVLIASRSPWYRPVPQEVDTALSRVAAAYKKTGEKVRYVDESDLTQVKFNEDYSRVISWNELGNISLWNVSTGELISDIQHKTKNAVFNNLGSAFLTWGDDNTVYLWNAEDGSLSMSLPHNNSVLGVEYFDNDQRILSWSADERARIWNASTGELLGVLEHASYYLRHAAVDRNNKRVLTRNWTSVQLWDASNSDLVATLQQDFYIRGAAFTEDGASILTWGANSVYLYDTNSGSEKLKLEHQGYKLNAIIDSKATRIVSWSENGTIKLWDAVDGSLISESETNYAPRNGIFVGSQSSYLIQDVSNTTRLWSAVDGDLLTTFKHDGDIRKIPNQTGTRFVSWNDNFVEIHQNPSQSGNITKLEHELKVVVALSDRTEDRILTQTSDGTVRLWNANSGLQIAKLRHDARTDGAIFSPNGDKVLSWGKDNNIRLWRTRDGVPVTTLRNESEVASATFNDDANGIVSVGSKMVTLWNATDDDPAGYIEQRDIRGVLIDRAKSRITTWLWGDSLYSWNWSTGKMISELQHDGFISGVKSNKDDSLILSWSDDSTARVWNSEDGSILNILQHDDFVEGATFLQEDSKVLTWSLDGTANIWDTAEGIKTLTIDHGSPITDAIISDDERVILTWGLDEVVRVWSTTGASIAELVLGSAPAGVALSRKGSRIATWDQSGSAKLWDLSNGRLVADLAQDGSVIGAGFSPNGSSLVTWSARNVQLWNSANGISITNVQPENTVLSAFLPDEKTIITRITDSVILWSAINGSPITSIKQEYLNGAVLNKSGNRVLSWNDNTLSIWNSADGGKISNRDVDGIISGASFSPDDTEIIVWNEDGGLQRWDVTHEMDDTTRLNAGLTSLDIGLCELGVSAKSITPEDVILAGLRDSEVGKNVCTPRQGIGYFVDLIRGKEWQKQ